ncbi:MAG: HAD family phosphatase [Rubrivivax sp.]|nr:MAG: HAD family phosphatase [Rubrivivax sp.]
MASGTGPCEAVVFDFGGVVFNWKPIDLILSLWPHLAKTRDEAQALAQSIFQSFVPGSDWAEFDRGRVEEAALVQRLAQRTGLADSDLHQLVAAIPGHLAPMAATVDWIERLARAGTRLHFLSNMPRPYAEHLVREHAFLKHFRSGVFSCEVGQIKPEAAIFETAARQFGLAPAACVFIDDHAGNVAAARQWGWRAVQFADAAQCERELLELGALPGPAAQQA